MIIIGGRMLLIQLLLARIVRWIHRLSTFNIEQLEQFELDEGSRPHHPPTLRRPLPRRSREVRELASERRLLGGTNRHPQNQTTPSW